MDLFTDNVALITRAAGVIRLRRLTRRRLTAGLAVGGRSGGRWQSPVSGEDSGTFLFLSLSLSLSRGAATVAVPAFRPLTTMLVITNYRRERQRAL